MIDAFASLTGQLPLPVLEALFDELPEVLFWVKDRDHRIVALNQAFAERVRSSPRAIRGKTDADLYYPELAAVFLADDEEVLRTARPIRGRIELLTSPWGGIEWRTTTKLPLVARDGSTVGTTGISQPLPRARDTLPQPYRKFAEIVEKARDQLSQRVTVQQLASQAGMSIATLERRFKQHLHQSPSAFLSQLRTSRAAELLRTTPLNMTEIADLCGYESPAAFSRAFRRVMHCAPSAYREEHR